MRLEAVTVCVGYGDFLAASAPYSLHHLDRWLIVTEPNDHETREVCRKWSLECLLTEDHKRGNFAKGRAVERGLQHLSADSWRLHLDADIVLPSRFVHLLESADLAEDEIYGCDRIMVKSWSEWQRLLKSGWLKTQHDYHNRLSWPAGFPVGDRWGSLSTGWVPIGFFQLWHAGADEHKGSRIKPYPSRHNSACRTDVQHALQFDRRKRSLIPEVVVAHLESEQAKTGANWNGRKTKRFGPEHSKHDGRCPS